MSALRPSFPFAGRKLAFAGLLVIACIAACAVLAPWVAPADPPR